MAFNLLCNYKPRELPESIPYTHPGPVAEHLGLHKETPRIFALAYYYDTDAQKPEEK